MTTRENLRHILPAIFTASLIALLCAPQAVIAQTAPAEADSTEPAADYLKARPEIVEQWKDMRYGMFLCWGPVSLTGLEIGWSRGAPEWGRRPGVRGGRGPTPYQVYDNLYKKWKPDRFDAEHWVTTAKAGGMKYLIFLVKHHDRYVEYLHGQVREILTNYGKIDGLWFDNLRGRGNNPEAAKLWRAEELFKMARKLQPHLIINDRCGLDADYYTPENSIGFFNNERPWETCATLNSQWAWKPGDKFFRTLPECIHSLVLCATGDGNLAMNTGPMPDGRIEPKQVERFREIGAWLETYGESIYGTRGGPFLAPDEKTRAGGSFAHAGHFTLPAGRWWGGSTWRDNVVYLHVLRRPDDEIVLPSIGRKLIDFKVLGDATATVEQNEQGEIRVVLDAEKMDPIDTIVKLTFDRSVADIEPIRTGPQPLSLGRPAKASGVWPDPYLGPELAVDGDMSTRWGGAPDTKDGWLEVDLGREQTIARLWISEAYDRIEQYELEVRSSAKADWQVAHRGTTAGASHTATFPPVSARYVRLNIKKANHVPTIWEFQVYQK